MREAGIRGSAEKSYIQKYSLLAAMLFYCFIFNPQPLSAQNFSPQNEIDMLLLKEDYRSAAQSIESLLQNGRKSADLYYKLGISYKKQNQFSKALTAFEKCLILDTTLFSAWLMKADTYSSLGYNNEAYGIYKRLFSADATNLAAGSNLASIYVDNENYDDAIQVYDKLVHTDSLNGYLYRQLGYCYTKLDSITYSFRFFAHALKLNPNDLNALRQLINNYIKKGFFGVAEAIVKKRYENDTTNVVLNKLLGEVYFGLKNHTKAIYHYTRAISGGDSTAYTYSKLGVSYFLKAGTIDSTHVSEVDSCYKLARTVLEKSLDKDKNPVNWYFYAMSNLKLKEYEKSVEGFDKAISIIIPKIMNEIYIHQSESFIALKQIPDAIEALKSAFFYKKENRELLLSIASLYENELFDYNRAVQYYTQYLEGAEAHNASVNEIKQKIKKLKLTK